MYRGMYGIVTLYDSAFQPNYPRHVAGNAPLDYNSNDKLCQNDFQVELLPRHSQLLGESLLVSFPPLINMLKSSGSSYLISGPIVKKGCWATAVTQSASAHKTSKHLTYYTELNKTVFMLGGFVQLRLASSLLHHTRHRQVASLATATEVTLEASTDITTAYPHERLQTTRR